jgi:hypothetical protein
LRFCEIFFLVQASSYFVLASFFLCMTYDFWLVLATCFTHTVLRVYFIYIFAFFGF